MTTTPEEKIQKLMVIRHELWKMIEELKLQIHNDNMHNCKYKKLYEIALVEIAEERKKNRCKR